MRAAALFIALGLFASGNAARAQTFFNGVQQPPPPVVCLTPPAADTLLGSTGSAACYVPQDASRPTAVQAVNVTTDANGAWTVTWARAFTSASPIVNPLPVNTGSLPILCNVATRSSTSASGKCWQSTSTTVQGIVGAAISVVVSPFAQPAANAAVMVVARDPTQ